jgi:hypothetical protein
MTIAVGKTRHTRKLAHEIEDELADIRDDLASLSKAVRRYGRARAGEVSGEVVEMSDSMMDTSREVLDSLKGRLYRAEKRLEHEAQAHPVAMALGALGAVMLVGMVLRRSR